MFDSQFHASLIACYEGDDTGNGNTSNTNTVKLPGDQTTVGGTPDPKKFDQNDVNKFLAEDRRKHAERYRLLEQSYEAILEDQNLATESRSRVETELEDLRASLRTKEQQIEYEKKQSREKYEAKLSVAEKAAQDYKDRYVNTVIDQSLQRAASNGDAFNDDIIVSLLKPITQLRDQHDDDGKPTGDVIPMTELPDIDEKTGDPIKTIRTPMDAVKRMKELPDLYGGLFRANVVSGVGQGSATGGGTPGQSGKIDPRKLTPEQYREIREKNPELLGLKRRNRGLNPKP